MLIDRIAKLLKEISKNENERNEENSRGEGYKNFSEVEKIFFDAKPSNNIFFRLLKNFSKNEHTPLSDLIQANGGRGMKTKDFDPFELGHDSGTQKWTLIHLLHRFGHSAIKVICSMVF